MTRKWSKGSGGPAGDECYNMVAHTLRGVGFDAGEDGTGRGTPLVPTMFSIMPMNSGKDYKAREVQVAQPLMAGGPVGGNQGGDFVAQPVAFHPTQDPISSEDGTTHAMGCGSKGGAATVAVAQLVPDVAPTLDQRAGRSGENSFATSGGLVPVAQPIPFRKSRRAQSVDDHETWVEDGVSNTLNCFDVGDVRAVDVVAQPVAMRESGQGYWMQDDIAGTLRVEGEDRPSRPSHVIGIPPAMQVRRLTPVECERLQGFSDGYTNIPWRKKPEAPDGPRYKALGNSMAVPCMAWIGKRIAEVDRGD